MANSPAALVGMNGIRGYLMPHTVWCVLEISTHLTLLTGVGGCRYCFCLTREHVEVWSNTQLVQAQTAWVGRSSKAKICTHPLSSRACTSARAWKVNSGYCFISSPPHNEPMRWGCYIHLRSLNRRIWKLREVKELAQGPPAGLTPGEEGMSTEGRKRDREAGASDRTDLHGCLGSFYASHGSI